MGARGKGLASLRKWKKCQRRVANAVMRAAKAGKANAQKHAQLKSAANAFASVACSKGVKKGKRKSGKRASRRSSTRSFSPPDFARQHMYRPPEPPFNPEVF